MELLVIIVVCILAGIGAGLGTAFAGMSAAAVISPMLIVFLGVDPYEAVGIALASDVLASAVSAAVYGKNKNIDLKNSWPMMLVILGLTSIGSFIASKVETNTMGLFSILMTTWLGIKFIVKPVLTTKEENQMLDKKKQLIKSLIVGVMIGFICGFMGAGGGLMMLMCLTTVLRYDLKTAVGTSVLIMTFTAFLGAVSHFVFSGVSNILILILCILSTLITSRIGAHYANKSKPEVLNRATGIILTVLGVVLITMKYIVPLFNK